MSSSPAAGDAAPAWDSIRHDVRCPLCDYNLRGLTDPRCPECGHRFDWAVVTDPNRRLHPYLFEHHPERNIPSFSQPLGGPLRPRRFWDSLPASQPIRPGRMRLYAVLAALVASTSLVALLVERIAALWV